MHPENASCSFIITHCAYCYYLKFAQIFTLLIPDHHLYISFSVAYSLTPTYWLLFPVWTLNTGHWHSICHCIIYWLHVPGWTVVWMKTDDVSCPLLYVQHWTQGLAHRRGLIHFCWMSINGIEGRKEGRTKKGRTGWWKQKNWARNHGLFIPGPEFFL